MTALLLEPHPDDAALFAAFTCLSVQPLVVTVLHPTAQWSRFGITAEQRLAENRAALEILGCEWERWAYDEREPPWGQVEARLSELAAEEEIEVVYAPLSEPRGHKHHNMVGELAARCFPGRAFFYATYTRGGGRSVLGEELVPSPRMLAAKLRALACYESQMRHETGCQDWFLGDQREYVERGWWCR